MKGYQKSFLVWKAWRGLKSEAIAANKKLHLAVYEPAKTHIPVPFTGSVEVHYNGHFRLIGSSENSASRNTFCLALTFKTTAGC